MNFPLLHRDTARWLTAAPLWDLSLQDGGASSDRFRAPAILRFKGDSFMDQAAQVLSTNPGALAQFAVRAETWRKELAGWDPVSPAENPTLYHPIHNRFYLVAASLVCRQAGLPDRKVDAAERDQVYFVLRRLAPRPGYPFDPADPAQRIELGWHGDAQNGRWVRLTDPTQADPHEERLALFPIPFQAGTQPRRLHAGIVPVARGATYANAAEGEPAAADRVGDPLGDPRGAALAEGVLGALAALAKVSNPPAAAPEAAAEDQERQVRAALALAMLDLAEHLEQEIPALIAALRGGSTSALSTAELALRSYLLSRSLAGGATAAQMVARALDARGDLQSGAIDDDLTETIFGANPGSNAAVAAFAGTLLNMPAAGGSLLNDSALGALLVNAHSDMRIAQFRELVEDWLDRAAAWSDATPSEAAVADLLQILFELDDFLRTELPEVAAALPDGTTPFAGDAALLTRFATMLVAPLSWGEVLADARGRVADILAGTVGAAPLAQLSPAPDALRAGANIFFTGLANVAGAAFAARPLPEAPPPAEDLAAPPEPRYIIRCVYERPRCAGIHPPAVSDPTRPFRLAGFFDPDAPARPLRIEMPANTSIADFRRAPKSVAIRLSKELRKQVSRVRDVTLDEPLADQIDGGGSFGLGVICSLSIPIITICALILLLIIVQLLNIVFWWLPYFMLCFPVRTR
jgi:hypothetical protein